MKKLFIIAFIFLVILALFKCNPLGDDLFVKLTSISPDAKVSHMP